MPNLHPLIVHFPIALFVVTAVCEFLAYFKKSETLNHTALITAIGAMLGAIAAVGTGLLAESIVPDDAAARAVLESHETLAFFVLGSTIVFVGLKLLTRRLRTERFRIAQLIIGLIGVVFVVLTAHEGGELVFNHAVGVDISRQSRVIQTDSAGVESGARNQVFSK